MNLKNEKTSYLITSCIMGTIFLILSFYLACLSFKGIVMYPTTYITAVCIVGFVTAIIDFLSIKIEQLKYITIFLTTLAVSLFGFFQQLNITILYLIPIYLSFYAHNKKLIFITLISTICFFVFSKIGRAASIYLTTKNYNEISGIFISTILISFMEGLAFISIATPIFMNLLDQNAKLKKSLVEIQEIVSQQKTTSNDLLKFCSMSMSYHNKYLQVHIRGVKRIAEIILTDLQQQGKDIPDSYYNDIIFSVQFHDLGKIYIDSSILDKNGKLTKEEYELVKQHPSRGTDLFKTLPKGSIPADRREICKNIIEQHHERLDGTGYPNKLEGNQISFEARVIAVADVADALLSWRPYKSPMTWDKMLEIFIKDRQCYDQDCLDALIRNKDKILKVSNEMNNQLQELLNLSDAVIARQ